MSYIFRVLSFIWFLVKKGSRDLALTLYDDFEFKYISLPRVVFALASACVVISWVGNQFFGYKFDGFTQLVGWATTSAAAYGVKKYADSRTANNSTTETGGNQNGQNSTGSGTQREP